MRENPKPRKNRSQGSCSILSFPLVHKLTTDIKNKDFSGRYFGKHLKKSTKSFASTKTVIEPCINSNDYSNQRNRVDTETFYFHLQNQMIFIRIKKRFIHDIKQFRPSSKRSNRKKTKTKTNKNNNGSTLRTTSTYMLAVKKFVHDNLRSVISCYD